MLTAYSADIPLVVLYPYFYEPYFYILKQKRPSGRENDSSVIIRKIVWIWYTYRHLETPKLPPEQLYQQKKDMITSRRTPSHLPLAITIIYDWLWTSLYLRKEATDSFLYQGVKTLCTTDNASKVTFSIFFWTYILLVEMLSEKLTLNHAIIKLKLFGSLVSAVLLVSGLACHHIYCRYIFFKRC